MANILSPITNLFKGNKSKNEVNINTSTIIENMTTQMSSTTQETYQNSLNVQSASIEVTGTVQGNVTLNQTIDVSQSIKATVNEQIIQQVANTIESGVQQELKQMSETKSGLFSIFSQKSSTDNINKINSAFNAVVNNSQFSETVMTTVSDTTNIQNGTIKVTGTVIGNVKIDQNIIVRLVAINILDKVFSQVNTYLQNNKVETKVQQSAKTESGMGETEGVFFIIACIVCSCCIMVLAVVALAGLKEAKSLKQ